MPKKSSGKPRGTKRKKSKDASKEHVQKDFQFELINQLVEVRKAKGLTQVQLAEVSGLKPSALSRLENLKATPQINTLFKILTPMGYKLTIIPQDE